MKAKYLYGVKTYMDGFRGFEMLEPMEDLEQRE